MNQHLNSFHISLDPNIPLKTGYLLDGDGDTLWELYESRKKAPKKGLQYPISGKHYILQFGDKRLFSEVDAEAAGNIFRLAFTLAEELAVSPGRYRICQN